MNKLTTEQRAQVLTALVEDGSPTTSQPRQKVADFQSIPVPKGEDAQGNSTINPAP
jgi:hypothetical protein